MMDDFVPPLPIPDPKNNYWVIIFLDMLSLLLAFFILLFATSTPDPQKLQEFTGPMMDRHNRERPVELPPTSLDILTIQPEIALNLDYLNNIFKQGIDSDPILDQAQMVRRADCLIISLPSELIFETGRASLKAEASKAISTLSFLLMNIDNRIEIRGHTDPNPISGGPFTSNWELSLGRARTVVNSLRDTGYDRPVLARGLADSFFSDIDPSLDDQKKFALGRRVDIIIYPSGVKE